MNELNPELSQALDSLLMQGANHFDPVGFRFIEAMAKRALLQNDQVKRLVEIKLTKAVAQYRSRFDAARAEAALQVSHLVATFPAAKETAQQLFAEGNFKGVTQLRERLSRHAKATSLAALTQAMQSSLQVGDDGAMVMQGSDSDSLEALLKQQEKEALRCYGQQSHALAGDSSHAFVELKSMQLFRHSWAKLSVNKRVAHIIDQAPKEAGPLNSHTLVIRSLATMREISPDYLNRFVSYIDTLLWLEKAGDKNDTPVDKTSTGKAKTKYPRGRSKS